MPLPGGRPVGARAAGDEQRTWPIGHKKAIGAIDGMEGAIQTVAGAWRYAGAVGLACVIGAARGACSESRGLTRDRRRASPCAQDLHRKPKLRDPCEVQDMDERLGTGKKGKRRSSLPPFAPGARIWQYLAVSGQYLCSIWQYGTVVTSESWRRRAGWARRPASAYIAEI